jgi:ELWxxDGT repeat protein
LLICSITKAQLPVLLKDIYSGWNSQSINFIGLPSGKTVFQANNGINGAELWITDGTSANTYLLKDINPNSGSSDPSDFIVFNYVVYFAANDGTHGKEFWVTDGIAAGTLMVKDINPGISGSNPKLFTIFKNKLYFNAWDFHGFELWVSDGTNLGTQLLIDINQTIIPISSSNPRIFKEFNNKLYFMANDGVHGDELWVTDSSALGTQMIKDIWPGKGSSIAVPELVYNNKLYFAAYDSIHGVELWTSDGTDTGTQMLKDILPGIYGGTPGYYIEFNNKFFFSAIDGIHGAELWVSDGTVAGTQMLKNIYLDGSNSTGGDSYPWSFVVFNNKLIFVAEDSIYGNEPWVTDGTSNGTFILVNIAPYNSSSIDNNSFSGFTLFNNKIYFTATNTGFSQFPDYELWSSDGTVAGTCMVIPATANKINPLVNYRSLSVCNGDLYFRGSYTTLEGDEPYVLAIDTTNTATYVDKINSPLSIYPNPCSDFLYFNIGGINSLKVFNLSGVELLDEKITNGNNQINVSNLMAGMYLLEIKVKDKVYHQKFIKE